MAAAAARVMAVAGWAGGIGDCDDSAGDGDGSTGSGEGEGEGGCGEADGGSGLGGSIGDCDGQRRRRRVRG